MLMKQNNHVVTMEREICIAGVHWLLCKKVMYTSNKSEHLWKNAKDTFAGSCKRHLRYKLHSINLRSQSKRDNIKKTISSR